MSKLTNAIYIQQSKALNSNSGVAFSPPSIVKDALGDSGMLLDTDVTITNSPDASPSQVSKLMKKIANKAVMGQISKNILPLQSRHSYELHSQEQSNKLARFKLISYLDSHTHSDPFKIFGASNNTSDVKHFNDKIYKSLPTTTINLSGNSPRDAKVNMVVKGLPMQSHFNPFADENDSSSKFQLSKSITAAKTIPLAADITKIATTVFNKPRFFGNDRTNLIQIDRLQMYNRSQNVINLRRENFQKINFNNSMLVKSANNTQIETQDHSQSSQLMPENPVMFRNYDLNDDYWLNFE